MTPLRFAVIGSPIGHSKSPLLHTAAYRALGLPHSYERIEVTTDADLVRRVHELREGVFAGLNVTVPHKRRVLELVDDLDASAAAVGAANTLVREEAGLRAHNTDAPALVFELERLATASGSHPRGRSAVVIGDGGAARAAIFALGALGAAEVTVRARRPKNEVELRAALAAGQGRASGHAARLTVEARLDRDGERERPDLAAIVQTTTAGMHGSGVPGEVAVRAVDWASVPDDAVALDVVYAPARASGEASDLRDRTPFVEAAFARGLSADGGLGMLARQGALAFELWLGLAPPFEIMLDALRESL